MQVGGFGAEGALSPDRLAIPGDFVHDYVHCRGVRFHVAVAGDPADPLVVLLHGAGGAWFDFVEVIAPLAAAGYRVAAVDLRGHGMSDKPPTGADLRSMCGDVAGIIGALSTSPAIVVGYGTGGAIGWALAAAYPQKVSHLVSIAAAHPFDMWRCAWRRPWAHGTPLLRGVVVRLPSRLIAPRAGVLAQLDLFENTLLTHRGSAAVKQQARLRREHVQVARVNRSVVRTARLALARIPHPWAAAPVTCPVLFFSDDSAPWAAIAARAGQRCRGDFHVATIPGCRNMPHVEQPHAWVEALTGWLG